MNASQNAPLDPIYPESSNKIKKSVILALPTLVRHLAAYCAFSLLLLSCPRAASAFLFCLLILTSGVPIRDIVSKKLPKGNHRIVLNSDINLFLLVRMEAQLISLLDELKLRLQAIHADPMSSVQKPSYTVLAAIRALLPSPQFTLEVSLIEDIISQCVSACEAVDPVVCCDSPEGYLPEPLTSTTSKQQPVQAQSTDVTSRTLLLNGWKTVMESVTIIGHLVGKNNKDNSSNKHGLVDCATARRMIAFLYELQLRLVHRGAFEQCARAFSRLVFDLWGTVGCVDCCSAIVAILQEIQTALTADNSTENNNNSQTKFLLTRRSAGLPFVLQSILAAEQWAPGTGKVRPKSKRPLNSSAVGGALVGSLVELLQPSCNRPQAWQVVTSLNILKALVTDSRLAAVMAGWIEAMFGLCLDGWFDRRTFPGALTRTASTDRSSVSFSMAYSIQNAASGLFAALVTRVFGVGRLRAGLAVVSPENRMSLRLFFTTYPSLFPLVLRQLEAATTGDYSRSLYPGLVLLGRLTQTTATTSEAKRFKDFDFDRLLSALETLPVRCPDTRLGDLAIRAYAQLLPTDRYFVHFERLLSLISFYLQVEEEEAAAAPDSARARALFAAVRLNALLVQQLFSSEARENTPRTREVLLKIYKQIGERLLYPCDNHHRRLRPITRQTPHQRVLLLLHARLYTLATVASWREFESTDEAGGDDEQQKMPGQVLLTSLLDLEGQSMLQATPTTTTTSAGSDQRTLAVALMMDALVHFLPITEQQLKKEKKGGGGTGKTQLFGWRIQRLASSLQEEPTLDARLLLWSFLNELLLFTYVDQKVDRPRKEYRSDDEGDSPHLPAASSRLLRREHFTSDTVFDRELDEVMAAVRQLATAGRLDVAGLKKLLLTDLFFQVIIAVSEELRVLLLLWKKKSTTDLTTGSDVQWDIVHEALRLLHNARQLEIIPDSLGDFFQELQRRSRFSLAFPDALSTRLLMELFEQAPPLANPLTNGHLSMTALLQLALVDEVLYDDEKCEVVFHFEQDHLALARQLHRLARNACLSSVGLRQVAAICLTTSLPIWARIASSVNEKEYRKYPKLFLDDHCSPSTVLLPQMLCTLFSALFELLADWDGGVVKRAEELVRSLADEHLHLGAEKLEHLEISNGKLLDSFSAAAAAATRLAVAIFAELHRRISGQPLASFALLRLTVELFLEDVQEEELPEEEEESSPFEKSKLNGPSHFESLAEMLLQELATLKAVIQSASVCEPQVETVLLSNTVQAALGETEMVPEALLADLIKDIRYIETKAKEESEQSSPNRFEHIITKLKRAFIC